MAGLREFQFQSITEEVTSQPHQHQRRRARSAHLLDDGTRLDQAIADSGMTLQQIADATCDLDPDGRGVSLAMIGFLVTRGRSRRTSCGARTADLVATVLGHPAHALFTMPTGSTLRMKGNANAAAHRR